MSKQNQRTTTNSRLTIGVLVDSMVSGYQIDLWRGIKQAAKENDVNLLCFVGREIESQLDFRSQANAVYDLATAEHLDGLIMLTGTLAHFVSPERLGAFLQRYAAIPSISIALEVEGMPSILLDNKRGTLAIVDHLIEVHGYQQIAFVRMREGHAEGDQRFAAYQEALARHGIAFNPDLVVPGEYYDRVGEAIEWLYDQRKVTPQAIVVVDDYMAIPMQEQLQARGLRIPDDVAVVGFDDVEEARFSAPPLTTLRQPLADQAAQAVSMLLDHLQGKEIPKQILLSPQLILRESCGCTPTSLNLAIAPDAARSDSHTVALGDYRDTILAEIVDHTEIKSATLVQSLLDAWMAAIEQTNLEAFSPAFSDLLQQTTQAGQDILAWQTPISILRRHALQILPAGPSRSLAENVIQLARVMIAEQAQHIQAFRRLRAQNQEIAFRTLSQLLNTATKYSELADILANHLPELDIPDIQIVLYEQQKYPSDELRLILSLSETERTDLPGAGRLYPATDLLPQASLPEGRRFSKIIEPLYFQDSQFGFAIFEAAADDETIYDALAQQISSSLQGVRLVQQVERRAVQLLTAAEVSRATTDIMEPELLLQKSVDLVQEHFDLYYAGIFIKDESGRFADLKAGTGQPGKQMMEAGWRLEIGGRSMIGRCIANGKADIQLDINKAPIHLRNPHLPETNSEMALPLISRGEIVGALTIQSKLSNAFTPEDASILQTMANQIATALSNANLFEQTQTTIQELEAIQRRYEIQAWSEYTRTQAVTGYQKTKAGFTPLTSGKGSEAERVFQDAKPITYSDETEKTLAVPILLRDQPIGVLGIRAEKDHPAWSDDEIALVQNIAEQFALAAESLRLLDETQRRAARERLVAEITGKLRATNDPQTMLQTAVVELRQALNAQRAQVLIQPPGGDSDIASHNPDR